MECQDCGKNEAIVLAYDTKRQTFFFVCNDCIDTDTDKCITIKGILNLLGA